MDDIYNELNTYLKGSSKSGINETIAEFMLTRLTEVPHLRASDIAERCHTSTPSVIRFCRELGYEGYADFKDAVEDYCQNVEDKYLVPRTPLRPLGSDEAFAASLHAWLAQMQGYAQRALLALDRPQLIRLARDIVDFPHVYVFGAGYSGLIAEQLRIRLARSGKLVIVTTPRLDMPLTEDPARTLAVIISQHGRFFDLRTDTEDIARYLYKNCAKTWLITQEPASRKFPFEHVLRVPPGQDFEVEYHTLIYLEELLGECCRHLLEQPPEP